MRRQRWLRLPRRQPGRRPGHPFLKDGDYAAFAKVLAEAKQWLPIRLLGCCVLPNHGHLVLWPHRDLSEFLRWLTVTPTQRYHAHYHPAQPAIQLPHRSARRSLFPYC